MSVDRSDPAAPLIHVGGDLAYTTAAPLREEIDRLLATAPPVIGLDFGDLRFIDSTGLAVIVHAWREGQQAGVSVRLHHVPRFLTAILDLTGVTGLLARPVAGSRPDTRPAANA
ncbi:anti-sigma factor antagonist [Micromonospora costi]|uniref:Anti-sigma factor antagonist n=1 Tax=Micromonospora costi TaxID=1530042 RepID=A0A3A9ZUH2_9ACTN|nr:anti-sigma factor antagonist [Micromonospora costi]